VPGRRKGDLKSTKNHKQKKRIKIKKDRKKGLDPQEISAAQQAFRGTQKEKEGYKKRRHMADEKLYQYCGNGVLKESGGVRGKGRGGFVRRIL